jgi:hypothetical protein
VDGSPFPYLARSFTGFQGSERFLPEFYAAAPIRTHPGLQVLAKLRPLSKYGVPPLGPWSADTEEVSGFAGR